jgi:SAM-dependent methyltransferase
MNRRNEADRTEERWQPPAFEESRGVIGRVKAAARRLLDLQAASLWRDLKEPLSQAKGSLLDVGAGAQPYRGLVGKQATYRAIDTSLAGEGFGYELPDTEYFEGDVWPVADASVDLLLATETLEHVPRPDEFLQQSRRVLRPGGRVVLTVPFSARWHYVPHDYWRFTPSGLRMILEGAGFTHVVVHARGNEVTVACSKAMALMLPFLLPQGSRHVLARRVIGLVLSPMLLLLAVVGQASLRAQGGEDCLGYTVFADSP